MISPTLLVATKRRPSPAGANPDDIPEVEPFDPLTAFAGVAPIAWYDAADLATVAVNGSNQITSWADKGTRNNPAIPIDGNPVYSASTFGGVPAIVFPSGTTLRQTMGLLPFGEGDGWAGPYYFFTVRSRALPDNEAQAVLYHGTQVQLVTSNYGALVSGVGGGYPGVEFKLPNPGYRRWPDVDKFIDTLSIDVVGTDRTNSRRSLIFRQTAGPVMLQDHEPATTVTPPFNMWEPLFFSSPWNGSGGRIHEVMVFNQAMSNAQVAAVKFYLRDKWMGVIKHFALFVGDSLTNGYTLSHADTYPAQLSAVKPNWEIYNGGVTGHSVSALKNETGDFTPLWRAGRTNIAVLWGGANDINGEADSAATIIANITAWHAAYRALGWKTIAMDLTAWDASPTQETKRQTVNAALLANWSTFADGFVQLSADASIGAPGAWSNGTYFLDTIHLTSAGYLVVKNLLLPEFNRVAGL